MIIITRIRFNKIPQGRGTLKINENTAKIINLTPQSKEPHPWRTESRPFLKKLILASMGLLAVTSLRGELGLSVKSCQSTVPIKTKNEYGRSVQLALIIPSRLNKIKRSAVAMGGRKAQEAPSND